MTKLNSFFYFTFSFFAINVHGQEIAAILTNEKLVIQSKVLSEERAIFVRTPPNYSNSTRTYPVAYMLDGQFYRINLATGIIDNLVLAGFAPDMILVSIPNTQRRRDMTPSIVSDESNSGGADRFLQFIETELIPIIESKYRVQPHRTIIGHSLSGLLVVYAFASRPELFNAYLAASPHLQWDNYIVLRRLSDLPKSKKTLRNALFVALGNEPEYSYGFTALRDTIKKLDVIGLDHEFRELPEENHSSINIPVFHLGLKKVWEDLYVDRSASSTVSSTTLSHVENIYKKASAKHGYEIPIPEEFLDNIGRRLMRQNDVNAALQVFQKSINLYPSSANAYTSFAEALENSGQLKTAKENLETAASLVDEKREPALALAINENLQRVNKKLEHKK